MYKKIFSFILAFTIIFAPVFLVKAEVKFSGLVPVCNTIVDKVNGGYTDPCDFNALMSGINNFITFLLVILATPLFALILVYVGWLYLSDRGSAENVKKAKTILKNAFFGYIIALAAWLIVKTILLSLGFKGNSFLS